jgi:hypothetical protein
MGVFIMDDRRSMMHQGRSSNAQLALCALLASEMNRMQVPVEHVVDSTRGQPIKSIHADERARRKARKKLANKSRKRNRKG